MNHLAPFLFPKTLEEFDEALGDDVLVVVDGDDVIALFQRDRFDFLTGQDGLDVIQVPVGDRLVMQGVQHDRRLN